jgi:hypothetical protein
VAARQRPAERPPGPCHTISYRTSKHQALAAAGIYDPDRICAAVGSTPGRPRPSAYTEGLWGFLLTGLPGGRTRLVISGYQALRPRQLERLVSYWLYVPVVWPMQARMLAVLKRHIERTARGRTRTPPGRPPSLDVGEAHQVAPEPGRKPPAP